MTSLAYKLTPIQMPHIVLDELKSVRKAFTKDEWLDVLMRSISMEPDELTYREKWLLLTRMIPLVENNFNLCELGPTKIDEDQRIPTNTGEDRRRLTNKRRNNRRISVD